MSNDKFQKIRNNTKKGLITKHSSDKDFLAIKKEVDNFLRAGGQEALTQLIEFLKSLNKNSTELKHTIKEAIRENIVQSNAEADTSNILSKNQLDKNMPIFDGAKFLERKWKFVHYILKSKEYCKLMSSEKRLIFVKNYNYKAPNFEFENNFNESSNGKDKKSKIFNDLQFYINNNGNMIFAKNCIDEYTPISKQIINEEIKHQQFLTEEDKALKFYNPNLYNKNLSISMYILLDGDPNKAHSIMRYDGCNGKQHKNMFLPQDKRRAIFGDIASNPHFHFQNEDDNLICSKKIVNSDKRVKWKTGRCNAIDINHLIKYLVELDNSNRERIEMLYDQERHYNMPFLNAKYNNKVLSYDFDIYEFLKNVPQESQTFVHDTLRNVKQKLKKIEYKTENPCFRKLVFALLFIKEIYELRKTNDNLRELKILSQIEYSYANALIDSFSNNKNKLLVEDYKPKYIVDASHLNQNDNEEEKK